MAADASDDVRAIFERRDKRQRIVEETLKLIDKAEERYRLDKENRRRWNRILIRLEDSLVESKRGVEECDTLIAVERGKAPESEVQPEQPPQPSQAEGGVSVTEPDLAKRAAYKIAETPIEALPSISLQEAAFARAYMERRAFGSHDRQFRKRFSAKLELAGQLSLIEEISRDQGERRNQLMLRQAVGKVQKWEINNMSDYEIDLVVGCYTVLSNKLVSTANNKRLMAIISRMIGQLRAERTRRRRSSR